MERTIIINSTEKYNYLITPALPVVPVIGIDKIQRAFDAVCHAFNVKQELLKTDSSRRRNVCMCRQAVWKIVKEDDPHIHLKSLGEFFGKFDHTTVIHGMRAITNAMLTDEVLVGKYQFAVEIYVSSEKERPDENYYEYAD